MHALIALILSIEITVHLFYQIVTGKTFKRNPVTEKFEEQVPGAYAEQLTVKKVKLGVGFLLFRTSNESNKENKIRSDIYSLDEGLLASLTEK